MYTLINGQKVKDLRYAQGKGAWEISQYYWYGCHKVQRAYNTETGEIKIFDVYGNILYIESEPTETE